MRAMLIVIIVGVAAIGGYLYYKVQTVTHDPAVWHVDPLTVPPSPTPNSYRVAPPEFTEHPVDMPAPIYGADAQTLAAAFDSFVMAQPRVEQVAGSVDEAWLTYVQRTEYLQVPDYISVRFYDLEETPDPAAEDLPAEDLPVEELVPTAEETAPQDEQAQQEQTQPEQTQDAPARATIAVYSRSRFGYGDMGVNEARVKSWLGALESFEE